MRIQESGIKKVLVGKDIIGYKFVTSDPNNYSKDYDSLILYTRCLRKYTISHTAFRFNASEDDVFKPLGYRGEITDVLIHKKEEDLLGGESIAVYNAKNIHRALSFGAEVPVYKAHYIFLHIIVGVTKTLRFHLRWLHHYHPKETIDEGELTVAEEKLEAEEMVKQL